MEEHGYKYDVFISYPHGQNDEDIAQWVTKIFLSYFKQCLLNSVGRSPNVYIDVEAIQPGDKWKLNLKEALARTKILVPIWSINYFNSEYCRGECAVMLHRERQLGYWTDERRGSLIVPIQLWDGDHYPSIAQDFHQLQFEHYSSVREGSEDHDKLKKEIKDWVQDLAQRIEDTPPWDPAWLTTDWLDDPIKMAEKSKMLWPPKTLEPYHLERMGWDIGGSNG